MVGTTLGHGIPWVRQGMAGGVAFQTVTHLRGEPDGDLVRCEEHSTQPGRIGVAGQS